MFQVVSCLLSRANWALLAILASRGSPWEAAEAAITHLRLRKSPVAKQGLQMLKNVPAHECD
jgi:hypothetical protein